MKTPYLNRMLIALLVLTAVALLAHRYAMNSVIRIDGNSDLFMQTVDDSSSGGKTRSTLKRENGALVMDCDLSTAYQWPYCEIAIELKKPPKGIDLTRYERVRLWARYEGPEEKPQIRFFIRNFDPVYSNTAEATSLKVNEITYVPSQNKQPLDIKLSQFTVASWWASNRPMPIEKMGTQFDNVSVIEISTGDGVLPGKRRLIVEGIEFESKILSSAELRLIIIAVWVAAVISYLVIDGVRTRRQLNASDRRQLSLKRINESLRVQSRVFEKLAHHDPLTGVLNRKGLAEELLRVADTLADRFFPLSLVFIDVDHFKRINDQYGHGIGDQVIKDLAAVVKNHIQRDDLLARWGGEEFLLICPHTKGHEAVVIAERLRQVIATTVWPLGLHITSSFGVSEVLAGEDLNASMDRADKAMYRAKKNGRDRVEAQLPEAA
jgi:diguanylate cyclase (GGDEF)-like protein